ncbi:MAG: single-stranded-DNA-specific exonuclease RecJ [Nannocystaceae bacterium]|nr:single-stranded-DNA-specific exonuclease RecJ [bacterium]
MPLDAAVTAPAPTVRMRREGAMPDLERVAAAIGVAPLTAHLVWSRGVDDEASMRRMLAPSLGQLRPPTQMAGFEAALDLLEEAKAQGWRVGIFGDYDVDGVTTATILSGYLEALGLEVVVRVAQRERGYGFGVADAQALHQAGATLVLCGDTGTSDLEALGWLREHGVKSVVIDHHQVPEVVPPTDALINPHQEGCGFPFKGLCSAGVAFYLCAGLRTRLAKRTQARLPDPRTLLDLVALATVCDMMPLCDENRVLVASGLRHLQKRGRPGVAALLDRAGVDALEPLDAAHLGFKLGPRINAPGRLGPAEPALHLLRARTPAEAGPLADRVDMLNEQRKRQTERIKAEASALLSADPKLAERAGLVVAHDRWAAGVVGIAATGLVEQFDRPVAVLGIDAARGIARGSVRSCGGVDVRAALAECAALLERFGGHREAAGLTLAADNVDAFVDAFDAAVALQRAQVPAPEDEEIVDAQVPLCDIGVELCDSIRRAGPFGMGFDAPRFIARGCEVVGTRVLKERHLALTLAQDGHKADAIAFGMAHLEPPRRSRVDLVFVPQLDVFRGVVRVKMHVQRLWRSL